jgi:hypothetical protein
MISSKEVVAMREHKVILLIFLMLFIPPSAAEEGADPLTAAGFEICDTCIEVTTLGAEQFGRNDRVMIILHITSQASDDSLILNLRGTQGYMTVDEQRVETFSDEGIANVNMTYDSWQEGEHTITLEITDLSGKSLRIIELGTFDLVPALQTPHVSLQLSANGWLETGDDCLITRIFVDETGPRWGADGTRSISGAPFKVLDSDQVLDCSIWPAGEYELMETYQNSLGQTTTSWLNFTIHNRPPPEFALAVQGDGFEVGKVCSVRISTNDANQAGFLLEWQISPELGSMGTGDMITCADWPAGVYKILLKVTNSEGISTTKGLNLIRVPASDASDEELASQPVQSVGSETETQSVGWYGIGGLSLLVAILVFLMLVKQPVANDDEIDLNQAMMMDAEGLATHVDEAGIIWRQHLDGGVDWWDEATGMWQRW